MFFQIWVPNIHFSDLSCFFFVSTSLHFFFHAFFHLHANCAASLGFFKDSLSVRLVIHSTLRRSIEWCVGRKHVSVSLRCRCRVVVRGTCSTHSADFSCVHAHDLRPREPSGASRKFLLHFVYLLLTFGWHVLVHFLFDVVDETWCLADALLEHPTTVGVREEPLVVWLSFVTLLESSEFLSVNWVNPYFPVSSGR
jgi:hypothetical protein